ncbi:MAG TPA: hypothetical protein VNV66_01770 [Pilimelia sp.]|nr:hypothetical protein [Pilimelia sp.]
MTHQSERLVAEYLEQVATAAGDLPGARRDELLRDLREHIDTERSALPIETEAEVRTILERLGPPEAIAAAAATQLDTAPAGAGSPDATASGAVIRPPADPGRRRTVRAVALVAAVVAIVLLTCALALFFLSNTDNGTGAAGLRPTSSDPTPPSGHHRHRGAGRTAGA